MHRVAAVTAFRPEIGVVPNVLADRHGDLLPGDLDRRDFFRRLEIAVLVKDIVGRQQRLDYAMDDPSVLDYSSRITTANAGFGTGNSLLAFEQRTEVGFTTGSGVPEPSSLALVLTGAAMATAVTIFQRRRSKPSA